MGDLLVFLQQPPALLGQVALEPLQLLLDWIVHALRALNRSSTAHPPAARPPSKWATPAAPRATPAPTPTPTPAHVLAHRRSAGARARALSACAGA
mmetsp:Transcript_42370/g.121232  ORF Transcript_42370/g.121232 Transcript_42370/m.121232 type:complete len:96 (+) Transcript_42370:1970-2257(+)